MSCRDSRSKFKPPGQCLAGTAGFTLIEVLVAIAVLAVVLGAIGAVVGTTVKSIRSVDRRLPLLETAQSLLAALPSREEILSKVLYLIQASAQRLVVTLSGVGRNLAVVVDQAVKENKFSQ